MPDPVLLLNTSILTGLPFAGEEVTYYITRATPESIAVLTPADVVSAIGHASSAEAMSEILGFQVEVNRVAYEQRPGQSALVLKLRGRLPEGQILDRTTLERIGYDLFWLFREDT